MSPKAWRWRVVLLTLLVITVLTLVMWMADAMGASRTLINAFFLVASIAGYALIGMVCRTSNYPDYFVAGRRIPAPFNGMATAADWMSAASFIGLTGLLLSEGLLGNGEHAGGMVYVVGWTGGFCLLAFLFAGRLNASGAITLPQFLSQRFDSPAVRVTAALGAILCSSVYLVAQIYGVGLVASMLSGLTFELGVFMALGGILMCSFLGGMRAVTWTQVVQSVVIVVAMLTLAVAVSWKTQGHPLVTLAAAQSMQSLQARVQVIENDPAEHATREAMRMRIEILEQKIADPTHARDLERQRIAQQIRHALEHELPLREVQRLEATPAWREPELGRLVQLWEQEREQLRTALGRPVGFQSPQVGGFESVGWRNSIALVLCLILGTAALPHILVRSYTAASPRQAERSVVWALFFIVLVYLTASSLAVLLKNVVLSDLVGASLQNLPEWAQRLRLRKLALLELNDHNQDGLVQFADISLLSDYLMLGVTEIVKLSPVFTGLLAAGALAAALSTADGLLITIANAFAQDMYFLRKTDETPPLKQVMLSKILLMVVALLAAWVATNRPVSILFWVTSAFSLAAATFFPSLLLGLYWSGMRAWGAMAAMWVGAGVSVYYIGINFPAIQTAFHLNPSETLWWGLDPVCAGVFGVPAGFLAAFLGSGLQRLLQSRL